MRIAYVKRGFKVDRDVNLNMDGKTVILSGPKFGHIAYGYVLSVSTAYNGADHDIQLTVLVARGSGNNPQTYEKQMWYVKFRVGVTESAEMEAA